MSKNLLLEIGTEEIPHEILSGTITQLKQVSLQKLNEAGIEFGKVFTYGTPRRLALQVFDVEETTIEKNIEKKGPPVSAAFDGNGNPTKALEGFLRGQNAEIGDVQKKEINGNLYVVLEKTEGGEKAADVLPSVLKDTILSLNFPKTMRWGNYKTAFVRPIRWIVSIYAKNVLPFSIENINADKYSRGHRLLYNEPLSIKSVSEYRTLLKEKGVVVDQADRRNMILDKVEKTAERLKAVPILSESLLDTLVSLTEAPSVAVGRFEKEFLSLPKEVLISEMVDHQKFVPLSDKNGNLINNFIIITNNQPNDDIAKGNERVIRARFSDGKFFFDEDRKKSLDGYLPMLKEVAFAKGLGSVYDKVGRIMKIAEFIADMVGFTDIKNDALRSAELCKADLVTGMVNEFDELQGVMGGYYAISSNEKENVAKAIREHYLPRFSGDALPETKEGIIVSLSDRIDNLFALYSQGRFVTGSKDPFALRRQTLGIIRILIEKGINLDFAVLFDKISPLYKDFLSIESDKFRMEILSFITTRIKTVFKEYGFEYDEIEAGITEDVSDIYDSYQRIQSIHDARKSRDFENLAVAFKRIKNIIKDQKIFRFAPDNLKETAEKELYSLYTTNKTEFESSIREKDYKNAVSILTSFRQTVDKFFDDVLVMDKDEKIKNNRVALLSMIDNMFASFIDFEKIIVE
jgi:glycyl-tRNA synthetase beta chain